MLTAITDDITESAAKSHRGAIQGKMRTFAQRRLNEAFEAAKRVFFDDSSRIVLFSDCHRGNNGRADEFARNADLFLHALTYYYRQGFTYVEVGDGDDLWKNRRFGDIWRAHRHIFDLLHRFNQQNRLHLIVGNHDIQGKRGQPVAKDGIVTHEGLILHHCTTGQRIFVVHGHQADFKSEHLQAVSRLMVRYIWKLLQTLGFRNETGREGITQKRKKIDQRLTEWAEFHHHVVICGHTHRPMYPMHGAPPYFNTGSCVIPGNITGLEIQNGEIAPIRWRTGYESGLGDARHIERELTGHPTKLRLYA
jgi:UDP-2,3-diacylglucosamine pyrophosphatase LpxH